MNRSPVQIRCRSSFERREDVVFHGEDGADLFALLRRAGQPIASSCTAEAVCGKCVVEVLLGEDRLTEVLDEEREILARHDAGPKTRLACRALIREDGSPSIVLRASYW